MQNTGPSPIKTATTADTVAQGKSLGIKSPKTVAPKVVESQLEGEQIKTKAEAGLPTARSVTPPPKSSDPALSSAPTTPLKQDNIKTPVQAPRPKPALPAAFHTVHQLFKGAQAAEAAYDKLHKQEQVASLDVADFNAASAIGAKWMAAKVAFDEFAKTNQGLANTVFSSINDYTGIQDFDLVKNADVVAAMNLIAFDHEFPLQAGKSAPISKEGLLAFLAASSSASLSLSSPVSSPFKSTTTGIELGSMNIAPPPKPPLPPAFNDTYQLFKDAETAQNAVNIMGKRNRSRNDKTTEAATKMVAAKQCFADLIANYENLANTIYLKFRTPAGKERVYATCIDAEGILAVDVVRAMEQIRASFEPTEEKGAKGASSPKGNPTSPPKSATPPSPALSECAIRQRSSVINNKTNF